MKHKKPIKIKGLSVVIPTRFEFGICCISSCLKLSNSSPH